LGCRCVCRRRSLILLSYFALSPSRAFFPSLSLVAASRIRGPAERGGGARTRERDRGWGRIKTERISGIVRRSARGWLMAVFFSFISTPGLFADGHLRAKPSGGAVVGHSCVLGAALAPQSPRPGRGVNGYIDDEGCDVVQLISKQAQRMRQSHRVAHHAVMSALLVRCRRGGVCGCPARPSARARRHWMHPPPPDFGCRRQFCLPPRHSQRRGMGVNRWRVGARARNTMLGRCRPKPHRKRWRRCRDGDGLSLYLSEQIAKRGQKMTVVRCSRKRLMRRNGFGFHEEWPE
jgi:hypothetical protein